MKKGKKSQIDIPEDDPMWALIEAFEEKIEESSQQARSRYYIISTLLWIIIIQNLIIPLVKYWTQ